MKWEDADLLQMWSDSHNKWLLGYGCYDNVAARIIPRITSKIITQTIMNIIFCKIKKNINLQDIKITRHFLKKFWNLR